MFSVGFRSVTARVALTGALVAGLVACGGDDDEEAQEAQETQETQEASSSYCDNLVDFNNAALQTDLSPESTEEEVEATAAEISPRWDALRESAPADLRSELEPLDSTIEALEQGDAEPFNADETFVQYTKVVSRSLEVCDFETAAVEAGDYWYEGVPDDLSAGTIGVELTNTSDAEVHEFVVFKKNDPDQPAEDILAMDEAEMDQAVSFTGATFAPPGETGAGLMEFDSGSYLAVCFVPIGGEDGAPHFTAGQVAEFTVS